MNQMLEGIRKLSPAEMLERLAALNVPYHQNYLAMYSSWYGGIVTDPGLMMVPVDDHLVHRGDGIFEAFKCVGGKIYGLERHLNRLERSARGIFLELPFQRAELTRIVRSTILAAGVRECIVRLFVSRGPGGFTTNPYECPSSQLYVVCTRLQPPPASHYEQGVTLKSSHIPIKKAYLANMKSCNYLPNVLMKKEAEDAGVHFTVSIDDDGFMGEGATENVGIITRDGEFLVPRFDRVLRGTTVMRIMELATELVRTGELSRIGEADITPLEAYESSEVLVFGTSFDVLPVVRYDERSIGNGAPGPMAARFLELIRRDMATCDEMLTDVED
jgi:branched-subunit amino acid aminotransferase/4-amino-4-deoxychorismate lyase